MKRDYNANDYVWIKELLQYPLILKERLGHFEDTSEIRVPDDPIEQVIFQDHAKKAIRKIAHKRGHVLMVGRPGTGKSMLAGMLQDVLAQSLHDYIRPRDSILAYPGKDRNHIRIAYEDPATADRLVESLQAKLESIASREASFSLAEQIDAVRRIKIALLLATFLLVAGSWYLPLLLAGAGITGIGSIFLFLQENNHRAQEKIQQNQQQGTLPNLRPIFDMLPVVLYDPRQNRNLLARIAEPNARVMKGGTKHG